MQKLPPASETILHMLAYQYLCQGKIEKAQTLLELLVLQNPTNNELRLALGYALLHMNKAQEAVQILGAMENSPEAVVHFVRAKALAEAGFVSESQIALNRYRLLLNAESDH